jgi:hypothetical protein
MCLRASLIVDTSCESDIQGSLRLDSHHLKELSLLDYALDYQRFNQLVSHRNPACRGKSLLDLTYTC